MKPPPPRLPDSGNVTASAKPTATAASTAFPPCLKISTPIFVACASSLATMPFLAGRDGRRLRLRKSARARKNDECD